MGLKKCPICGEKFADTYKHCPFCEEDENPRKAKQPKRYGYGEGGRRLARRNYEEDRPRPLYNDDEVPTRNHRAEEEYDDSYQGRRSRRDDGYDEEEERSYRGRRAADYDDDYDDYGEDRGSPWFKIVMVILIAIIIACLLYLGRGVIGTLLPAGNDDPNQSSSMMSSDEPQSDDEDDQTTDPNEGTEPDVDDPGRDEDDQTTDQNSTQNDGSSTDDDNNTTVSGTLTLSHEDVSIAGDESFTLSARSGSGDVTYTSADPSIATVSSSGVVTGVKKGTTKITVRRGSDSAECIVRVKSNGSGASSGGSTSSGSLTLSHTDVSIAVDESFTLSARSGSGDATYTSADPSIATVSASGTVTGVKKGTTKITVSRGGSSATCIVRVK